MFCQTLLCCPWCWSWHCKHIHSSRTVLSSDSGLDWNNKAIIMCMCMVMVNFIHQTFGITGPKYIPNNVYKVYGYIDYMYGSHTHISITLSCEMVFGEPFILQKICSKFLIAMATVLTCILSVPSRQKMNLSSLNITVAIGQQCSEQHNDLHQYNCWVFTCEYLPHW